MYTLTYKLVIGLYTPAVRVCLLSWPPLFLLRVKMFHAMEIQDALFKSRRNILDVFVRLFYDTLAYIL
jgi:hypothetical protein